MTELNKRALACVVSPLGRQRDYRRKSYRSIDTQVTQATVWITQIHSCDIYYNGGIAEHRKVQMDEASRMMHGSLHLSVLSIMTAVKHITHAFVVAIVRKTPQYRDLG